MKAIRTERDLILSLTSLGLTPKQAFELISDPLIGQAQAEEDPAEGLVDASDRLEGGEVIIWWNDIEKDKRSASVLLITVVRADEESRYKSWPIHTQGVRSPITVGTHLLTQLAVSSTALSWPIPHDSKKRLESRFRARSRSSAVTGHYRQLDEHDDTKRRSDQIRHSADVLIGR